MSDIVINPNLPPTPRYILETYKVDVFHETVGQLTFTDQTIIDKLTNMCWLRFRNRPIGDFDYEYWLEQLNDKVNELWYTYEKTIESLLGTEGTSLAFSTMKDSGTIDRTRTEQRTDNLQTVVDASNTLANSTDTTGTNKVESEDNPDTEAGAIKYLNNRTTTTPDLSVAVNGSDELTQTTDNTGTQDTDVQELETRNLTIENTNGLTAETIIAMNEAMKKCTNAFVMDLAPLFMNRW